MFPGRRSAAPAPAVAIFARGAGSAADAERARRILKGLSRSLGSSTHQPTRRLTLAFASASNQGGVPAAAFSRMRPALLVAGMTQCTRVSLRIHFNSDLRPRANAELPKRLELARRPAPVLPTCPHREGA